MARKVEALRQVTRWLRGAGIDPINAEKVDLLELVWANLLRLYERDAALAWLEGVNRIWATAGRWISFASDEPKN